MDRDKQFKIRHSYMMAQARILSACKDATSLAKNLAEASDFIKEGCDIISKELDEEQAEK